MSRRTQEPWMREIRVGDVLECNGGRTQRVVRNVSFHANGDLSCVTFTIAHCSWTGACYTVLNYTDLRYRGFRPTGVRLGLGSALDRQIAHDAALSCAQQKRRVLTCCDVRGIP